MRRAVLIWRGFREAMGHEHPLWRAAMQNYAGLLRAMGLGEEEIRGRLEEVGGGERAGCGVKALTLTLSQRERGPCRISSPSEGTLPHIFSP